MLNGLGYLGLLAVLQLPIPQLAPFRGAVRWVLLGYTALTIVLYFPLAPVYSVIGLADKAIEVVLVALILVSVQRDRYEPAAATA